MLTKHGTLLLLWFTLATTSCPGLKDVSENKRYAATTQINAFCQALEKYYEANGRFPNATESLEVLVKNPEIRQVSEGSSLSHIPLDPWGNKYIYFAECDNCCPVVMSLGADGTTGGDGYNADIESKACPPSLRGN